MNEPGDPNTPLTDAIEAELRTHSGAQWTPEDLMSVPRLAILCERIGVSAADVLARALDRIESGD